MATDVDARGLSCPQPVIMTREVIRRAAKGPIEVLIETGTSRNNVARMARREGWELLVQEVADGFRLVLDK